MKHEKYINSVIFLTVFTWAFCNGQPQNWTHFRGNNLDAISEAENLPVTWNDSTNILWKAPVEGKGWSSPVVFDRQVWVTTANNDGKKMKAICLDFDSGREIYNLPLFQPDSVQPKHAINTYATPTPCIEKGFVYVHFGTYGTACINTDNGKTVWTRTDLNCEHVQGPGSSPILYKNLLILHIEGTDVQYLAALDKSTGTTVWRTDRPKNLYDPLPTIGRKAYITPLIVNVNGRELLISNGAAVCIAYDPNTGEEVWRIEQGIDSTIAMPFYEDGVVYFFAGFVTSAGGDNYSDLIAVNPDGKDDIAKTNIIWRYPSPILQLLTPVIRNGLIYSVDSQNNLICIDAKTGKLLNSRKLKQKYNASPVYADGKIYFISVKGETMVLSEGKELITVALNKIDGEVYATPAFVRNSILLRTHDALYRIANK